MSQKKMLNLGCGHVILPRPKPFHYSLLPDSLTDYPLWHNVDRNAAEGVDEVVDIFRYPFPWADNSFDGALLSHVAEHIPHEIKPRLDPFDAVAIEVNASLAYLTENADAAIALHTALLARQETLMTMQDGWYAFFSELHRVLTPGSIIHVLSPYAFSSGAMTDPTHTRYLTEHVWTHSMTPHEGSSFEYNTGGLNLTVDGNIAYRLTPMFQHLTAHPEMLEYALMTQLNVAYEMYARLRVVK